MNWDKECKKLKENPLIKHLIESAEIMNIKESFTYLDKTTILKIIIEDD